MALNTSALERPRVDFRSFRIGYTGSHVDGPRGGTLRVRQNDTDFFRDNVKLAHFEPGVHLYRIYRARAMQEAVPTAILRLLEKGIVTTEKDYVEITPGTHCLDDDINLLIKPDTTVIKLTKGLAQQFAVKAVTDDHGLLDHLKNRTLSSGQLIETSISEMRGLLDDLNKGLRPIGLQLSIVTEPLVDIADDLSELERQSPSFACASSFARYGREPLGPDDHISKSYGPNDGARSKIGVNEPANFLLQIKVGPREPHAVRP